MKNKRLWVSIMAGIMALILVLTLLLQLIPTQALAASSSEIRDQIDQMEQDQADLQDKLDELEDQRQDNLTEIQEIVDQKHLVDQQVALIHEQIDNMNDQISAYAVLIADKQKELDEAQKQLQEMKKKHMERIRAMEEAGDLSYWSVIFKANSFSDLLDRVNMIREIAAADKRRLEEMSEAAKVVEETQQLLREENANLLARREELAEKEKELEAKAEESKELLNELIAKGEEFESWMNDAEQELSDLEQEIADAEVEYDRVAFEEWLATSVPPTTAPPKPPQSGSIHNGGTGMTANVVDGITWLTPCNYNRIASTFGNRFHPILHIWKMHKGVDLAVGCTPIYATRGGVVVIATDYEHYSAGYYVMIDHGDGFRSVYMHMCEKPYVNVGDFVGAGQVIGCVGSTGYSTGSHLHFGISYEGEYVNPLNYIK